MSKWMKLAIVLTTVCITGIVGSVYSSNDPPLPHVEQPRHRFSFNQIAQVTPNNLPRPTALPGDMTVMQPPVVLPAHRSNQEIRSDVDAKIQLLGGGAIRAEREIVADEMAQMGFKSDIPGMKVAYFIECNCDVSKVIRVPGHIDPTRKWVILVYDRRYPGARIAAGNDHPEITRIVSGR